MRRLLTEIGSPETLLPPVVHVAGTNAKGSVLALLRAMLEADGRRVHSYHSPPLLRFHECIRLATAYGLSADIADDQLADILTRVVAANAGQPLTSFEGETAAAMLAFSQTPADILLLETGLGGRLDATNVVPRPLLTVITPVDYDHVEMLGSTLAAIASEKAGIFRRDVPAVIARQHEEALSALRVSAATIGAPLFEHGQHWDAYEQHGRLVYQDENGLMDLPLPALTGRHQIDNAGTAVAVAQRLGALTPLEPAMATGLTRATWPGRLQSLSRGPLAAGLPPGSEVWVDGGHNAAAAAVVAQSMAELEERAPKSLHLILGMLTTKSPEAYLKPFRGLARSVAAIAVPDTSRAYAGSHTPDAIAEVAMKSGIYAKPAASLGDALQAIAGRANGKPVRVLICGSLHLAGTALREGA